jgi:Tfp pilus assembly protein FimT
LVELLMVVLIMAILAGLVWANNSPALVDQLQSAAQVMAYDLAYGRSLAVANNDTYRFTFNLAQSTYTLQYSGTNPALANLPRSPIVGPNDTATTRVVALSDFPNVIAPVQMAGMGVTGNMVTGTTTIQFTPLGGTSQTGATVVWLSAGSGTGQRYLSLSVNPVTGLVTIGALSGTGPPSGCQLPGS